VRRDSLLSTAAGRRCAEVADQLAIAGPFSMNAFQARLEQVTGRETRLIAMRLPAALGSGIRLAGDGGDYFYYQEQTSPFHQAHIVVGLAARKLLAGPEPVLDARLARGLEPRLVRHILGSGTRIESEDGEADFCAYLVLEGLRPTVSRLAARRLLADLQLLPRALAPAVPDSASGLWPGERVPAGLRLYQVVTGILDLMLAFGLNPGSPAASATLAGEATRLASMPGELDQFFLRGDMPPKVQVTDPGDGEPFAGT
jgi:hypothetical protein